MADEDNHRLHVTPELTEDANRRRQIALEDAKANRWRQSCIFVFALLAIAVSKYGPPANEP